MHAGRGGQRDDRSEEHPVPATDVGILGSPGRLIDREPRRQTAGAAARLAARCVLAVLLTTATMASGEDSAGPGPHTPVIRAERLSEDERILLDGVLAEPAWGRAQPAAAFLQREPVEGGEPTQATEVHVAYDADSLYLGVQLHDTDPDRVIGYQRQRDADLSSDDRFMWVIDTFLDGRTAYFFEINPSGLMGDGLVRATAGLNKSWDGLWEARVLRGEHGWSAEVRIPFRTLNFDPRLESWGINFQRTVRRHNEEVLWSGHRRNEGLHSLIHAGRLVGLAGMSQGHGLEARPYTAASWKRDGDGRAGGGDVGIDVSYSLTPGLRAALTVNTDFAETDVDQRQVNLTRFPLQYPERRQFFLEGSSVYSFAPSSGVTPYFSRRIGLVDGEAVPILYGARLGGQAGAYDIGLLQVRTGREGDVPAEDFTVARVRRNILRQSSLGVLYTRRASDEVAEAEGLPPRTTLGADLDLNTSTFMGNRNLRVEGFYAWHTDALHRETPASERSARGLRLAMPQDAWRMHLSWREFGREWDPAVGFAGRNGFRRVQPAVAWSPRPGWRGVRRLDLEARFEHLEGLDGQLETQRFDVKPLEVFWESGDRAEVLWVSSIERLDEPFTIRDGVVLPPGDYRFHDVGVNGSTASRRRISAWGNARWGEFWSGTHVRTDGGLTLRPASGVRFTLEGERRNVHLPQGDFTTTLGRAGAQWQASPWTSLSGTVQYDTVSRIAGLYSRLRWTLRPGSDLYVVYTHNWRNDLGGWGMVSRSATSKINYTHRF